MRIVTETIDLARDGNVMRVHIARPAADGRFPALAFYSDIFQLTESTQRTMARFAGYGFVVAAPELYWRFEPPGTAIPFDDPGRDRGQADALRMRTRDFDDDIDALIAALPDWSFVAPEKLGAIGFCLGGHVAFRAAFHPKIRATACLYPTGLHDGQLAGDGNANSLGRLREIHGLLRIVYGRNDPHTNDEQRLAVFAALVDACVSFEYKEREAEHAFMRDVGPRYDPAITDREIRAAVEFFTASFREFQQPIHRTLAERRDFFRSIASTLELASVQTKRCIGWLTCPCCGYLSASSTPRFYTTCRICRWEDDGQDDKFENERAIFSPDVVAGGPNLDYSLSDSRRNFVRFGQMYAPGEDGRSSSTDGETYRNSLIALFEEIILNPQRAAQIYQALDDAVTDWHARRKQQQAST